MSYANSPPKYMTTLIPKTTSHFCHEWQRASHWEAVISSSPEELASSSSSASSLASSPSSSEACGDGDGDAVKPPMIAYRHAIWPTWVFTWHNSSLRVSRWASMCSSCAIMATRVIPLMEEEGVNVDGSKWAGRVVILVRGRFGWS